MSIKFSPFKGKDTPTSEPPTEKWFNTRINGVECTEIRQYLETLSPSTFKLEMAIKDLD